mgnify:CR=1 FL=1
MGSEMCIRDRHPEIGKQIEDKKEINDELVKNILEAVKEFA